eukprot:TRINITY_DN2632_c0_g1_i3.p1 TRINITY_DN2632_c0_g1~~TRINITY_DN2632_c0_g1_i3.p1  ORF type:complete len:196 (+),score=15.26 TRINITY_DN2632_c0_g1_i3:45-632(+)
MGVGGEPQAPAPGPAHSKTFVCSGCSTMMSYPDGAVLVSCATCKTVSNVAPASNLAIQIPCVACKQTLQFPLSTSLAQCPLCKVVFRIATHVQNEAVPAPAPAAAPSAPGPDVFARRPTTASTRTASVVDTPAEVPPVKGEAPPEASASTARADWQDVWQGKGVKDLTSEEQALMAEFDQATLEHDMKTSAKKKK